MTHPPSLQGPWPSKPGKSRLNQSGCIKSLAWVVSIAKSRKIKCDEARPACRRCTLRRTPCSYAPDNPPNRDNTLLGWPMTPASMSPLGFTETRSPIMDQPLFCAPSADPVDMKLLWHYTSDTYKTLSYLDDNQSAMNTMLQTVIVQHAFESPFLLYSILELASLHMQSLGQPSDTSRALMYRVRSYQGYLEAMIEASPRTFGALQANSIMILILSARSFRDPSSPDLYLLDWMLLWHGIPSILEITSSLSIEQTGLSPLFVRPPLDPDVSPAAIPKQLLLMVSFISPGEEDGSELQTYQESLRALSSLFEKIKEPLDSVMVLRIVTWGTWAPRRLVELAQARRPRALVILAHYAVFLKLLRDIWWLEGVGDRSIRDICHALEPAWHKYLGIPLAALLVENGAELSRVVTHFE